MEEAERQGRIARRRRVVELIRAMHARDQRRIDDLVAELARDSDLERVVGALGVAGSTLAELVAKATTRSVDDVLDELEDGLASAPVE